MKGEFLITMEIDKVKHKFTLEELQELRDKIDNIIGNKKIKDYDWSNNEDADLPHKTIMGC